MPSTTVKKNRRWTASEDLMILSWDATLPKSSRTKLSELAKKLGRTVPAISSRLTKLRAEQTTVPDTSDEQQDTPPEQLELPFPPADGQDVHIHIHLHF